MSKDDQQLNRLRGSTDTKLEASSNMLGSLGSPLVKDTINIKESDLINKRNQRNIIKKASDIKKSGSSFQVAGEQAMMGSMKFHDDPRVIKHHIY